MEFNVQTLLRENIKNLKPYSSARHEFTGKASIFIDANENAEGSPLQDATQQYNRYPDPLAWQLKFQLARIKGVPAENIFIGNGSDEVIDLAFRIFCTPSIDNVIVCPPTYGMYNVSAGINDVATKKVNLLPGFQLNVDAVLNATDDNTKLIFICSPNNPTGNSLNRANILHIIQNFKGIVLIDEAYINYSKEPSFIKELVNYPNIVVMQTLSKAWGLAALRIGMCFASLDIIDVFNKVKPPYNVNEASQQIALEALQNTELTNSWTRQCNQEKQRLQEVFVKFNFVEEVFPSDANFLLVRVNDAQKLYDYLCANEIVTRNRSKDYLCENCIRFTIGTNAENEKLIEVLNKYQ